MIKLSRNWLDTSKATALQMENNTPAQFFAETINCSYESEPRDAGPKASEGEKLCGREATPALPPIL